MPSLRHSRHHRHHDHCSNKLRLGLWMACGIMAVFPLYFSINMNDTITMTMTMTVQQPQNPNPNQPQDKDNQLLESLSSSSLLLSSSSPSSLRSLRSIRPHWNHSNYQHWRNAQTTQAMYYNNIRKRPPERPILSPFTEDHPRASPQQLQQAQESMRQRQQRFPKLTNLKYFETNMVQETIQLHDRYMLQAHAYMRKWMDQPHDEWKYPNIASTNNNNNTPQQQQQQKVCVVIQTSHRVIPYIFSLLYSILSGHSPNEWHAVFQTHLLHSEHRPARLPYTLFEQSLKHIPLFHKVHYAPNTTDPNDYAKNIMRDTIHALQICQQANLTWCLVLEDDAVVMPHLATVLPELLSSSSSNSSWQTANVSQISLYAYYNTIRLKHLARLENPDYAAQYERDVNPYHPRPTPYFLHPAVHPAGTVANMYHGKYVPALIAYLQSWLHPAEASGKSVARNVDVYISNPELFLQTSHSQRWQTTPSLVNHVGFYSERMENVHDLTSQLATDVRFRLEVEQSQSNDEG